MPDETRHESQDLEDYEVLDWSDPLDGARGDGPLDGGVVTPDGWSAGIRYGTTAGEQQDGESLDQSLAEEEPDVAFDADDDEDEEDEEEEPGALAGDEDIADEDIDGLLLDDGPDPRAGRLVAEDEGAHSDAEAALVASDVGDDAGGGDPGAGGGARGRRD